MARHFWKSAGGTTNQTDIKLGKHQVHAEENDREVQNWLDGDAPFAQHSSMEFEMQLSLSSHSTGQLNRRKIIQYTPMLYLDYVSV
eukprot:scaffold7362_cov266-Pinguiococcus_pyrenoidosus.AAC.23